MGATNCPETPRQKMITMMYLVYTAMLALNVSAQVVDGFKTVGSAMTKSNENLQIKLDDTYANFEQALKNSKDKVQEDYDKAQEVRQFQVPVQNLVQHPHRGERDERVQYADDIVLDKVDHTRKIENFIFMSWTGLLAKSAVPRLRPR